MRFITVPVVIGIVLLSSRTICAQTTAAASEAHQLAAIVVSATRVARDGFNLPMAIDRIDASVFTEDNLRVNLSEALSRVPGIVVQNRQNYAQDLQISVRGFGARSSFGVRGVRLVADGIPATMPDGQGQAASFSLASAQHIEVLRGPFSSLYGNSSGGVVQIFTADGPAQPTLVGTAFIGSFGTRKTGLQIGGEHQGLNYLVDASRFSTDGYRAHSAAVRDHLNAKFKLAAASGTLTIIINSLAQPDTQDPLGLTRAQMHADPRQADAAALRFNTRKSVRQNQLGAVYDFGLASSRSGALQLRLYGGDRGVNQYLGQEGGAPLSSGGVIVLNRLYAGLGLRWTRNTSLLERPFTFTAGFDGDRLKERRRGFVNSAGQQGILKRDEDDGVANADVYAQAEWQLTPTWSLSGGARSSRVAFHSKDYFIVGANPDDSGSVRYTRITPVAGILVKASEKMRFYASYGEGFETPTFAELAYRSGGATGLNFALQPSKSRHAEAGLKALLGANTRVNTRVNAALFRIDTRDEIVVNGSVGGRSDFRNAAQTRRDGFELAVESFLPRGFATSLAYTYLNARFSNGRKLPGVAQSVLFAELIWRDKRSGFHAAMEYHASSRVYVNDANSDAAASYGVVNLRAGFMQHYNTDRWRLSQFLRIDNVVGRPYVGSVIVSEFNGRFFEPAPGRKVVLGLSASLSF